MTNPTLTRRTVVRVGLGALAAGAGADRLGLLRWPGTLSPAADASARAAGLRELRRPRSLRSRDGRLAVGLRCRPAVVDMRAPAPVRTYTYDGVVPGHTWELRGGDELQVDLVNDLPRLAPQHLEHGAADRPHEWTTTNLHTHGLHVSPRGNADNVFLAIPPGERQRYDIAIPEDHPAGAFWYHPHRHGAVTQQVRAGMAGLIIVRGDLDRVAEVRAARERVLVLQAIELGADYALQDPIPDPTKEQSFFPRKQILYTVNGTLLPKITMYPGEIQRWRILNAAEGKFMSLSLQGHDINVIAWDGLTLHRPEPAEVLMLSAANRAEVLVRAGRPGVYDLVLTPGSSQKPNIPGMPPSATRPSPELQMLCSLMPVGGLRTGLEDLPPELQPRPIARLVVRGHGRPMRMPADLPAYDPPIRPIARRRTVRYTVRRDEHNEFVSFGIDGEQFDPTAAPYRARLRTAEEWTVVNECDTKLMEHAHVFHIHVNPFKVVAVNGRRLSTPRWRDTYVLTKSAGDSFTFQTNFDDFTGRFVQHCHVLGHEDLGMMQAVEVVR